VCQFHYHINIVHGSSCIHTLHSHPMSSPTPSEPAMTPAGSSRAPTPQPSRGSLKHTLSSLFYGSGSNSISTSRPSERTRLLRDEPEMIRTSSPQRSWTGEMDDGEEGPGERDTMDTPLRAARADARREGECEQLPTLSIEHAWQADSG
jgi:hypothetical protein